MGMVHCTVHNPPGNGAQSAARIGLVPAGHTVAAELPAAMFAQLRDRSSFECEEMAGPQSAKASAEKATAAYEEPREARRKKEAKRLEVLAKERKTAAEKAKAKAEEKAAEVAAKAEKEEAAAVAAAVAAATKAAEKAKSQAPKAGEDK